MADTSQGDGWWLASDGKWYPPESAAGGRPLPPEGGALGDGAEERGKSPWWKRRWVQITGAVFAALVIIGALSGDPDDEPSADGEAFATTTRSDDGDEPPIETTTSTTTTEAARSTTSTTSTTTTVKADPVAAQTELGLLVAMVVVAGSPVEPYERDSYQPAGWPDSDGDCQNDRHEVLAAESTEPVVYDGSGCFVETGRWIDPYDGTVWTSASEVTIDHVIPLGHAHRVGADRWDDASRQAFAADLGHEGALAVVGAAVNQSKADSSPASWRPPDRAAWCRYGVDWVHGKVRWGLGLESEAERDAIAELLATCDEPDSLPLRADQIEPPAAFAVVIAPVTTTTTTTVVPEGDAEARIVSCRRRDETVTIINDGAADLDLGGYRLHDEGDKHSFTFPGGTRLGPGETVTVTTGEDAATGDGFILWKRQNVWNNDGDTAYLVLPDRSEISEVCR